MELVNALYHYRDNMEFSEQNLPLIKDSLNKLMLVLAPFAPHIAEEVWHILGNDSSVHQQPWPKHNPKALLQDEIIIVAQINGKLKGRITVPAAIDEDGVKELVLADPKVNRSLKGKTINKFIYVKDKLVNIVVQ